MAAQCPGQRLRAFDAQPDATVLDGGYGPLGDPGQLCQFVLAQFLEFAQDTQRFSGETSIFSLAGMKLIILISYGSHSRNARDQNRYPIAVHAVD